MDFANLSLTSQAPQSSELALTTARDVSQAQMALMVAKRFPRDAKAALDRILMSCTRESLASVSQYQFARGGQDVSGPSIRLAEAIAQQWGNLECGWREINRDKGADGVGISLIEAYAWDLETNTRIPRIFTVRHWRDTKRGGYALADERDIYELCANQASRRLRACILAVIPGDIVEEAVKQCDVTLAAKADTSAEAQKRIVEAFAVHGVSKAQLEARLQRHMDAITAAQVIGLRKILVSLKDGMSSPADWFEPASVAAGRAAELVEPVNPFASTGAKSAKSAKSQTADSNGSATDI